MTARHYTAWCGTNAGYARHLKARKRARAEGRVPPPTCEACRAAHAAYQADIRATRRLLYGTAS